MDYNYIFLSFSFNPIISSMKLLLWILVLLSFITLAYSFQYRKYVFHKCLLIKTSFLSSDQLKSNSHLFRRFRHLNILKSTETHDNQYKSIVNDHINLNHNVTKKLLSIIFGMILGLLAIINTNYSYSYASDDTSVSIVSNNIEGLNKTGNRKECIKDSNPSTTTISCYNVVGLINNSLQKCSSKENCYSSSSKAAEKYLSPWVYKFGNDGDNIENIWENLISAIKKQDLIIIDANKESFYIAAYESSNKNNNQPKDAINYYEFLIRPADSLVLTRALVNKTIYLYPLQQPISDFNILQSKLNDIRTSLGWLSMSSE